MPRMSERDRKRYNRDCAALEAAYNRMIEAQKAYEKADREFDEKWNRANGDSGHIVK